MSDADGCSTICREPSDRLNLSESEFLGRIVRAVEGSSCRAVVILATASFLIDRTFWSSFSLEDRISRTGLSSEPERDRCCARKLAFVGVLFVSPRSGHIVSQTLSWGILLRGVVALAEEA